MPEQKVTILKDINPVLLAEEIEALGLSIQRIHAAGFEPVNANLATPARRLITRRQSGNTVTEDFAEAGEMRLFTAPPLDQTELDAVAAVGVAHDETGISERQRDENQAAADLVRLREIFDAGIPAQDADEALDLTVGLLLRDQE